MTAPTALTAVTDTLAFLLELGTYLAVGHYGHRLGARGRSALRPQPATVKAHDADAPTFPPGPQAAPAAVPRAGTATITGAAPATTTSTATATTDAAPATTTSTASATTGAASAARGWAAGLALVALFAAVWSLFGAPGATVPLHGAGRAVLEVLWFGGGAAALAFTGKRRTALAFGALYLLGALLQSL